MTRPARPKARGAGRDVVAYLAIAEDYLEEQAWKPYAAALTSEERDRIKAGSYYPLRRPHKPRFPVGAWIDVAPHLRVQLGEPEFNERRRRWTIPITSVQDFRVSATPIKTYGEDRDSMTNTLALTREHPNPPEPHGPGPAALQLFAAEAGAKRALGDSERTEARLAEIHQLPMTRRVAELEKLARERGVDVRDDLKAFERRVRRRLSSAA